MDFLTSFLINPFFWVILGVILVSAEMFSGEMYFLPNGISSLLISIFIYINEKLLDSFVELNFIYLLICYAFLSITMVIFLRYVFHKKIEKNKDINKY